MLSVKAGIDNNPDPTQADRIAGAKMKDKTQKANEGKVMPHMNPNQQRLDREPTEQEKGISEEAKKARGKKVWEWLLGETDNFGRGWTDPKWGKLYKGRPGRGGRIPKAGKYTVK